MKTPKCKICGGPHYQYQCWKNPKRKSALKRKYNEFKAGKTPKRDKVLSKQGITRKRLIVELDTYVSKIVRIGASDKFGVASCFTCGRRLPYKMLDCGHYKSRQYVGTRFDFDNVRPQCQNCNRVLHGNIKKYEPLLLREIGEERMNALEMKKTQKISTPDLEELLVKMKQKYKKLLAEKQNS